MKKSKWLLLVLVLILVFSLASCSRDGKPKYKTEALANWQSYTLVFPEGISGTLSDSIVDLTKEIKEEVGSPIPMLSDFLMPDETAPTDTLEILVGNTNREESKQVYETLKANDYFIGMVNNRLLIIGGSDAYTEKAIEHFMTYLVKNEEILYPSKGYTYESKYKVDKLTIGGVDISEYVIVSGNLNAVDKSMVEYLRQQIANVCGAKLSTVSVYEEEATYEILVGDTSREETSKALEVGTYAMEQTENKLAFYGNGDLNVTYSIGKFVDEVLSQVRKGKSYDINITNVFGEPFVTPSLLETNLPLNIVDISGEYDNALENVDSIMDRFFITKDELPDEITILENLSIDDYPNSKEKGEIYVSVKKGDDSNPGTKEAPYKTIEKAISAVKGKGGGIIWVEGGTYETKKTIRLDDFVSGTIRSPLFIIGYGDEKVTITGNPQIDSSTFKKVDVKNDPVAARLPSEVKDKVLYTNLYELGLSEKEIPKVTTDGPASIYVDGEEFTLARYPNAYYEDGVTPIEMRDLLYFNHVYDTGSVSAMECLNYHPWLERVNTPGSGLTPNSILGWEIRYPNRDMSGPLTWVNTGDIWYYGNVYSGWEFGYYTIDKDCVHNNIFLGTRQPDGYYSLKSVQPCIYGAHVSSNSAAGRNTFYLFNAIEALDVPGEWFIDKATGNLYIYPKTEDISKQRVTYSVADSFPVMYLDKASFIVLDNIHIDGSSDSGIYTYSCDNIVMQNISTTNTNNSGLVLHVTNNAAIINSEFSRSIQAVIVNITNADSTKTLKPSNIIFQNNIVRDTSPSNAYGLSVTACRAVISHNTFLDACMTNTGVENIIEYNEFAGGNKYVTDGGMVYMTGYNNRGHHIRYNLFHHFHATHNAIYNDGKTSGVYSYGNIVNTLGSTSNYNKGWYSSSGHGNVCYANIMVFRSAEEIAAAKGYDTDEGTEMIVTGDSINESGLFYYYYGDGDPRNSEAGHWWPGHRREEVAYRLNQSNVVALKQRFPDYMANLSRIQLILAAYDVGYRPTYEPQTLSGKEFVYKNVEDGAMLYIPEYEYINASGKIAVMPERTLTAENGNGFTVTYDDIAAMERLERQPAFAFISNNLILGGLRPSDTIDDVITNHVEVYKGFIDGTSAIYNNYYKYDYSQIMPGVRDYNYTISETAWDTITKEMNASFVNILRTIDYTRMGKIEK